MADRMEVIKERFEVYGLVDFKGIYSFANNWLVEDDFTVAEETYTERLLGNAKELNIQWKAFKEYSDYFKAELRIKFDVKNLKDVEVEIDGKKKKMNDGRVWMEIKGLLVKDMESKWDATPFNRFLRDIYNKYIIPSRIDTMEEKVKADVRQYKEALKAYADLTGHRPTFH